MTLNLFLPSSESVGRAAASIYGEESMGALTYSRIQQQLIYNVSRGTTLRMQPAAVHPWIATFVDFDKLIGVKVGVEELRVRGASDNPVAPKIQWLYQPRTIKYILSNHLEPIVQSSKAVAVKYQNNGTACASHVRLLKNNN